jgi:hypothetical protein
LLLGKLQKLCMICPSLKIQARLNAFELPVLSENNLLVSAGFFHERIEQHDNSGMRNKEETDKLETKGIILPLLLMPEFVSGRHIVR